MYKYKLFIFGVFVILHSSCVFLKGRNISGSGLIDVKLNK